MTGCRSVDVGVALLRCAESASVALGATSCRLRAATVVGLGDAEQWVAAQGYAGASESWATKILLTETRIAPLPAPPGDAMAEDADADALTAQLDFAASMTDFAKSLAGSLPDDVTEDVADKTNNNDDAPPVEDLVSKLLAALKTDQGRDEFRRLAADQAAALAQENPPPQPPEAFFAPRLFVPRPSQDGSEPTSSTSTTISNARAFAELLSADVCILDRARDLEPDAATS